MNRLRTLLALSHLSLGAGIFGVYLEPTWPAAVLIAAGAFTRGMVPSRHTNEETPARRLLAAIIMTSLGFWLIDLGLLDVLADAWDDRFSPRPLLCLAVLLVWRLVEDWLYFGRLGPAEIDAFYSRKS
jgi:hypothetical protein